MRLASPRPLQILPKSQNQFVVQAEAAYKGMLEAERAGNLASYKKFRSTAAVKETLENLRKAGTPENEAGAALQAGIKVLNEPGWF